jgi:hypothetical protein
MNDIEKRISKAKKALRDKGISNDRQLINLLKLNDTGANLFHLWVKYQGLYEYRNGYNDACNEYPTYAERQELQAKFREKYQGRVILNTEEESDNVDYIQLTFYFIISLAALKYIFEL